MLVLSRYRDETIVVVKDGQVVAAIVLVDIRGDKVRIGVDAPPEYAVHREEVWDAIQRNGGVDTKRPRPDTEATR